MENWSLRDEIIRIISKWYLALAAIILGGIVGFGFSYLFPAPYRATADLYVGIDITRVNEMEYLIPLAETEPLNLDDYKNWQLKQVSAVFSSDQVLIDVLDALGTPEDLGTFKQSLDLYWYDAGLWQLEAVNRDKEKAKAAVQAWLIEGHNKISDLLAYSDIVADLDAQLFALAGEIGSLKTRAANLVSFQTTAEEWREAFLGGDQDQPLAGEGLEEFNAWIAAHQEDGQQWLVEELPLADDPVSEYLLWLDRAVVFAGEDIEATRKKLGILEEEREQVLPAYHQALDDSLGLSANLVLEPLSAEVKISRPRSSGEIAFGGAVLGLLTWLALAVISIRRTGKSDD